MIRLPVRYLMLALVFSLAGPAAQAFDADEAQALAKKSGCTKCHSVDKEKKGPSFKKTSEKLRGKPDALDEVIRNITTAPMVKFEDGTEEEHKIVKSDDKAQIRNLAEWILSH